MRKRQLCPVKDTAFLTLKCARYGPEPSIDQKFFVIIVKSIYLVFMTTVPLHWVTLRPQAFNWEVKSFGVSSGKID